MQMRRNTAQSETRSRSGALSVTQPKRLANMIHNSGKVTPEIKTSNIMTLQHHLCEVIIKMAVWASFHEKAASVASVSPIIGVPANATCLEGSR